MTADQVCRLKDFLFSISRRNLEVIYSQFAQLAIAGLSRADYISDRVLSQPPLVTDYFKTLLGIIMSSN
jgi:hypothetical protein